MSRQITTNERRTTAPAPAMALAAALWLLHHPAQAQSVSTVTRVESFAYDAYGTLTRHTVEPGNATYQVVTDLVPNAFGLVDTRTTSWQDPLSGAAVSRVEGSGYDPRFRFETSHTNAKGQSESRTYHDGLGAVLTHINVNNLTTTWQYDGWGRKARETRADSTATTWSYRKCVDSCLDGAVSVKITQNWYTTSQTTVPTEEFTDTLGRPVLTRSWGFDGTAILKEKVYDSLGRVQKTARPRFAAASPVWTFYDQRDAIGRVTQIRAPSKTGSGFDTTGFSYNGRELTTTNAKGQTRTELKNGLGKLERVTDANAKVTRYVYDGFGNLVRTTDPLGNQIIVVYDRLGRKTALSDPNLGDWTYIVDPMGQTRRETDAKMQVTTFEFDPLGRMTRQLEPDLDSRWDYDTASHGVGQLGEAYTMVGVAKDYRRMHDYDALGRASAVTTSLDWDYKTQFTYDGFARAGGQCHYRMPKGGGAAASNCDITVYNAQGHVAQINRNDGSTSTVWQGLNQDAEGNTTVEQLGSGLVTQRGYNTYTGRLVSIRTGPSSTDSHQSDSYDYDALGNLSSRSQRASTGGAVFAENFTYDALNRLETSTMGAVVKTTTYNEIGNITSKTGVGTYTYPNQGVGSVRPQAVSGITGAVAGLTNPGFSYDANGNLQNGLARAHTWTSYNMPESIDKLNGAIAVQRTVFIYNPEHQRARQTVSPLSGGVPGAPTTTIWYAGVMEKEIDTAANTTTIRTQLPLGLGFVEEKIIGTAIAPNASATRNPRYLLDDHLGSTIAITDQAQVVLQRLSYDAWGRRRNADGSDDTGPLWGALKNNQDHSGYTGHEHLDQLGLVHMNARLYDPILGRHTSADPTVPDASNLQSLNRYTYVLNNALVFTDPTGLAPNGNWGASEYSYRDDINTGSDLVVETKKDPYASFSAAGVIAYRARTTISDSGNTPSGGTGLGVAAKNGTSEQQLLNRARDAWAGGGCTSPTISCASERRELREGYSKYLEQRQALGNFDADILMAIFPVARVLQLAKGAAPAAEAAPVFWSGGRVAEDAARAFAKANGGAVIGDTAAGRALAASTKGVSWSQARSQWLSLSEDFARRASGEVHVFQNARGLSVDSIWRSEFRILKQNPNVTKTNFNVVMPDGSIIRVP